MKTLKKIKISLFCMFVSFCCLSFFAEQPYSFYQDNTYENSSLSIGTIGVELREEFPKHDEYGATTTTKKFWGESIGSLDQYVRATINTNLEVKENGAWNIVSDFSSDEITYSIDQNTKNDWLLDEDGYWYYKKILKPNETTSKFNITNININKNSIPEKYRGKNLRINMSVSLESCQATNELYKITWNLNDLPNGIEK